VKKLKKEKAMQASGFIQCAGAKCVTVWRSSFFLADKTIDSVTSFVVLRAGWKGRFKLDQALYCTRTALSLVKLIFSLLRALSHSLSTCVCVCVCVFNILWTRD
jgi:hypothetical protein